MEAFLLNDNDEYLEMEFSPQGLYLFIMLDGYRNAMLTNLPLYPDGVETNSPCLDSGEQGCTDRWTSSVVIPRDYLPFQVSK